ncbi:Sphingosine N-acyltransferase-like protein FUM18, partial [Colletotrichum shisoi]
NIDITHVAPAPVVPRRSRATKTQAQEIKGTRVTKLTQWLFHNHIGLALYAIAPLLIANAFIPGLRPYASKFFVLSYHNPATKNGHTGPSQVVSVNIEARRKDYWETITRVGHLILVLMELILPLAKCLKYVGFTTLCDVVFGVFLFVRIWTRHVFYLMAYWSVYYDLPRSLTQPCFRGAAGHIEGPFPAPEEGWSLLLEPFRDPKGTVCMTDGVKKGFLTFLLAPEVVICTWSFFIVRVTVRVLKGAPAEDVRSEDEAEEEKEDDEREEEQVEYEMVEEALCVEEDVGVESIDLKAWERRNARRDAGSRARGARVHSQSDRKDLLNRIGCEKQIE